MSSSEEFFFPLVRIACAQIFRAAGVDRCSPATLDAITDILIRHLQLLSTESTKLAGLSGRKEVILQDLALAMEQVGCVIRPRAVLDAHDTSPDGVAGFEEFVDWAKGPVPHEQRRISRFSQIQGGGPASSNAAAAAVAAAQAASSAAAQAQTFTSQEQQQQTTAAAAAAQKAAKEEEEDANNSEWLTSLMKKQVKVGHEAKFKGTVLGDGVVQDDTTVVGGDPPPEFAWTE